MMNKRKLYPLTLSAILLASTGSASAQYVEQGFYIAPSIGYYMYDSDNDNQTDDAPLYGLNVGLQLSKYFALEAGYFRIESEVTPKDSRRYIQIGDAYILNPTGKLTNEKQGGSTFYAEGDDVSVDAYHVDAVFNIPMPGGISPYLAIGYTKLDGDPQLTEGKDDMMTAALGAKYYLTPNLFLQGDVRALHSWDNEDTDYSAGLGVGYLFGTPPAAPVPVEKVIEEPTPTPIPEEPDSDGDGVPDSRDKCPNTPPGETVDADGCPVGLPGGQQEVSITLKVLFDYDKSDIKPEYVSEVENLAKFMRDYPNTTTEIEGHTDHDGSNAYNQRLSQRRADSVRDSLITQFGIDANRLQAIGYGEERPIADNANAAGREQNRRVVATIRAIVRTPATP